MEGSFAKYIYVNYLVLGDVFVFLKVVNIYLLLFVMHSSVKMGLYHDSYLSLKRCFYTLFSLLWVVSCL